MEYDEKCKGEFLGGDKIIRGRNICKYENKDGA